MARLSTRQVFDIGFALALDSMRGVDNARWVKGLDLALHLINEGRMEAKP